MDHILTLPLSAQVGLGAGYLSYLLAFGKERRAHSATDAAFLSFVFGIPALAPMIATPMFPFRSALFGTMAALAIALLWRSWLARLWLLAKDRLGLGLDDGMVSAWDAILGSPGLTSSQISVHTTDGRILCLNNRNRFLDAPHQGLYLGSDGSVLLVVEEEEFPDGTCEERQGISDPLWGTRLTYVPPSQVVRLNIRF